MRGLVILGLLLALVVPGAARAAEPSLDSIPLPPSDRVFLEQTLSVSNAGTNADLSVPQPARLSIDVAIEPGKQVVLMVITKAQWEAASAGKKPEGSPLLRTTLDGVHTQSVSVDPGDYVMAVFAVEKEGRTQVMVRAHAGQR